MTGLPPEDAAPFLAPTSDVTALVEAGPPGPDNPVTVAAVFWTAATEPDGPDLDVLSIIVTPESWSGWGAFRRAAELLPGYGMAPEVTPADGDADVVYITYLRDTGETTGPAPDMVLVEDILIATLVRRPRLGGWRVHALGGSVRPERVPHDE